MTFSSHLSFLMLTSLTLKLASSQYPYPRYPPPFLAPSPPMMGPFHMSNVYTKPKCRNNKDYQGPNPNYINSLTSDYSPGYSNNYNEFSSQNGNFGGYPGTSYYPRNNRNQMTVQNTPSQSGKIKFNDSYSPPQNLIKPTPQTVLKTQQNSNIPTTPPTVSVSNGNGNGNGDQGKTGAESQQISLSASYNQPQNQNWNQNQNSPRLNEQSTNELAMLHNLTTSKFVPHEELKNCVPIPGAQGACVILEEMTHSTTQNPRPISTNQLPVALPLVGHPGGDSGSTIHHHHMLQPTIIHENLQIQSSLPKETIEIIDLKPSPQGLRSGQNGNYYSYTVNSGQDVNYKDFQRGQGNSGNGAPSINNPINSQFDEQFNVGDKLEHVNTMWDNGMKSVFGRNSISQTLQQNQNTPSQFDSESSHASPGDREGAGSEKEKVTLPESKEFYMKFLKLWAHYHHHFICKKRVGVKD